MFKFKKKIRSYKIKKHLLNLINENNSVIQSLSKKYKDNFDLNFIKKIDGIWEIKDLSEDEKQNGVSSEKLQSFCEEKQ